jgi:hypothetical protein
MGNTSILMNGMSGSTLSELPELHIFALCLSAGTDGKRRGCNECKTEEMMMRPSRRQTERRSCASKKRGGARLKSDWRL